MREAGGVLPMPSAGRTGRGGEEAPTTPTRVCHSVPGTPWYGKKVPADSQGSADTP